MLYLPNCKAFLSISALTEKLVNCFKCPPVANPCMTSVESISDSLMPKCSNNAGLPSG